MRGTRARRVTKPDPPTTRAAPVYPVAGRALIVAQLLALAAWAPPTPVRADERQYRYDEHANACLSATGVSGLNAMSRWAIGETRDGECVDARGPAALFNLAYVRWHQVNLRGADLSRNSCYLSTFDRTDLTGARLVDFRGGDCHFTKSNLSRADLRGADLGHASFDQETLLAGALFDEKTRLPFSREEATGRGMTFQPR